MVGPNLPRPDCSQLALLGEADFIHEAGTLFIDPGPLGRMGRMDREKFIQTGFDSAVPGICPYPMNFPMRPATPPRP